MKRLFHYLLALGKKLFGDNRSKYEKQRERSFTEAVSKLKNYYVTDRGAIFMDPEEVHKQAVAQFIEQQKAHSIPTDQSYGPFSMPITDCIQIVTWRRMESHAAVRYVCLQSLDRHMFSVAVVDYFSAEGNTLQAQSFDRRLAERLIMSESGKPLEWFSSLEGAMDAWDASL
ncbi:hypothetical protein [Pseudomonas coronafaciens]|uniref:Uncharacterized protein n=1 Tax=Pseudomonas coronafaciens pv. striafaciens TaxID=235276 RepID=A0A3M4YC23_9PSED|nr:hypothetical protein [Pseudomonas coronafaciens]RMR86248.1 hypothetical protein ALP78_02079 [Pseudomonas coronafaciens pv. striafaciens]